VFAFVVVAGSFWLACSFYTRAWMSTSTYRVAAGYGALSVVSVLTLAIERLIEPFSVILGANATTWKKGKKTSRERSEAAAARRTTAVATWGVATGLGLLFAGGGGVLLLRALAADPQVSPPWQLDLVVTGLVIGSSTKPVHDLISRLEKSRDKASDQAVDGP
jgi:hypothetical protein